MQNDDDITDRSIVSTPSPETLAQQRVDAYVAAALAPRTRKEYRADLQRFLARGGALPASPETVAHYLAAHAATHAAATLARWLVSIGRAHTTQGLTDPTTSDLVKATLRGIRRAHGAAQRQVAPTLRDEHRGLLAQHHLTTRYAYLYNHHIPQKALDHRTPIQTLQHWQREQPELLLKRVSNYPGPDMYIT